MVNAKLQKVYINFTIMFLQSLKHTFSSVQQLKISANTLQKNLYK